MATDHRPATAAAGVAPKSSQEVRMEFSFGKLILLLLTAVLAFGLPLAAVYWLFSLTPMGKNLLKKRSPEATDVTLEVANQLRSLQVQLDDAHSRLDFAERVMLEQREQLRGLGASEPLHELRQHTPV
jgi:hypothetical protein